MRTIEYLTSADLAGLYWPIVLAGAAVALCCSALSVLVVLRRLAFIGQGVSHAAFGGVGIAALLGLASLGGATHELAMLAIVLCFCIAAALAIARFGDEHQADTAIGIVLAGAMALGVVLIDLAARRALARGEPAPAGVESVLFGSFTSVTETTAWIAWIVALIVVGGLWLGRRQIVFWAFDPGACEAFGLERARLRAVVMVLLALAIVVTMRLAGVILATALLVLPGAIALRLSRRWVTVLALAHAAGLLGVLGGLVLSFEADLQPGPSVVGVLLVLLAAASLAPKIKA